MHPHIIKSFGIISWHKLKDYFFDNNVYNYTVEIKDKTLVYTNLIMFRSNKKDPETIYIEVSRISKNVIGGWKSSGEKFNSINEILNYTKK